MPYWGTEKEYITNGKYYWTLSKERPYILIYGIERNPLEICLCIDLYFLSFRIHILDCVITFEFHIQWGTFV